MADLRDSIRESKLGNLLVVLVTTALVIAGVYLVNRDNGTAGAELDSDQAQGEFSEIDVQTSSSEPPEVGKPAPTFSGLDIEGNPVVLDRMEGPTWIVFNATWCSACRAEVPDIKAVQDERGDEFNLVSVWVSEPRDTVADFVDRLALNYVHVVDTTSQIAGTYRTMGVPSHYFIDSDGILQDIYVGALSEAQMNEKLDLLTTK